MFRSSSSKQSRSHMPSCCPKKGEEAEETHKGIQIKGQKHKPATSQSWSLSDAFRLGLLSSLGIRWELESCSGGILHCYQTVTGKGDLCVLFSLDVPEEVGWKPGFLDWWISQANMLSFLYLFSYNCSVFSKKTHGIWVFISRCWKFKVLGSLFLCWSYIYEIYCST